MVKNLIPGKKSLRRSSYLYLVAPLVFIQILIVLAFRHVNNLTRFSSPPWKHPLPPYRPLDPSSALITQIPEQLPDGLGHRVAVINFELLLAQALSVRYIHRFALYDSLTRHDHRAVDRLFGWDVIRDTRKRILENCIVEKKVTTNCPWKSEYPICKALKRGARFDRLVNIPDSMIDCVLERKGDCWQNLKEWAAQHGRRTLFQMKGGHCHERYTLGFFNHTYSWFRNMYWNRVSSLGVHVNLNDKRFQIGVHIRRGDFLNRTARVVTTDALFAELVCNVKKRVDAVLGNDVPTDVHIFSEGVPKKGYLSRHDIGLMEKSYVTDRGVAVDGLSHWRVLVGRRCSGDIMIHTHIATDTIAAIRDMIACDVFIGSKSGLSMHVVDVLSRGLRIVPSQKERERLTGDWRIRYDPSSSSAAVNWLEVDRCFSEMKKDGQLLSIHMRG